MEKKPSKEQPKEVVITTTETKTQLKQPLVVPQKTEEKPKIEVNITSNTSVRVPRVTAEKIVCLSLILFAIPACIIYVNSDWIPAATYHAQQFNFQVYCPVYYDLRGELKDQRDKTFSGYVMQHFYSMADKVSIYAQLYGKEQKSIYVVKIMDGANQTNSTNYGMRYCGLARPRAGTCEKDAKLICTNPGPTFETAKDQQIVVIWVNQIYGIQPKYQNYVSKNLSSCYEIYANESDRPKFCTLMSKLPEFKLLSYEDPTVVPPADQFKNYTINNMSTPISPYVHGMIGRPTFNGGPLAWFTSKGQVGLGYSTAEHERLDIMNSVMKRNMKMNEVLTKRYRIHEHNYRLDIYQNRQPPANLMYYDTAISVAKKNLVSGLSGLYIIRDAQIQKQMPNPKYQHQILIHPSVASLYSFRRTSNASKEMEGKPIARASSEDYMIFRDAVYRFRLVNADFTKIYQKLKFVGTNSSNHSVPIQFYIAGSDSSLRNSPIGPLSKIQSIAPAQRFDILIKFDKSFSQVVDLVHGQNSELVTRIYLSQNSVPDGAIPKELPKSPYFNYSSVLFDARVARRRMRPLAKTSDQHIATNGHLTLFEGLSQDPQLGSVEDWYFINNLDTPQVMHIDLIQFQTLDQFTLNEVPNSNGCTFYNADFFMKYATACKKPMQIGNKTLQPQEFKSFMAQTLEHYQQICKFMAKLDKTDYAYCFDDFANEHENEGDRKLSGLDVQAICDLKDKSAACTYLYRDQESKEVMYKYRGQQIKVPEYRQGYKEIQIIPKMAYSRLRIRWARNDFPEDATEQNQRKRELYFLASEEQLSEYPGFTYRSTQVQGQQGHMMRPIMVQPDPSGPSKTWKQIYDKLNKQEFSRRKARVYANWYGDDEF